MGKLTKEEKESVLKFLKTNLGNNPLVKEITIKKIKQIGNGKPTLRTIS